ncbi:MAG: FAD:protein FMN transferase [Clostridia bacterium]|nr:FAD:protein FMN transferase [Clostridia bacterium]
MDTVFTLRIYGESAGVDAHFSAVLQLLQEIEAALSRTKEDSDISRINRARSAGELSAHTRAALTVAVDVMTLTDGAYLPTMGAITALWQRAGETNTLPDAAEMSAALYAARQGFTFENGVCTILGEGALLDLGGIGKGYAVDCVLDYLKQAGVSGALLSFGSSVATLGAKGDGTPFKVSLRHPRNSSANVGILTDPVGVLSVSGDYERYVTVNGIKYHHVLDPADGYPSDSGIASVAVLCERGAYSDALSTAFLVMGREKAEQLLAGQTVAAQVIFVTPEGETFTTPDLAFSDK